MSTSMCSILPARVLYIGANPVYRNLLKNLSADFQCTEAESAETESISDPNVQALVIEDVSSIWRVRLANDKAAILLLAQLESHQQTIEGLIAGADDFVVAPCSRGELEARIEAVILKKRITSTATLEAGPLVMNIHNRAVVRKGVTLELTETEFALLELFMRNQNKVISRDMISETLSRPEWTNFSNAIEVHINRLRKKVHVDFEPQLIFTIRGQGYMLRTQLSNRRTEE